MFLELAEILGDSIAENKMSTITWIIIILIIVSIGVTVTEVGLRFGMLSKGHERDKLDGSVGLTNRTWTKDDFTTPQLQAICGAEYVGKTFKEL